MTVQQTPIGPIDATHWGSGETLVVLVHASASGPNSLTGLARALERPGRRLIAPALQGYAGTDVCLTDPLEAHLAVVEWAIGQGAGAPVVVFGHSMGGLVALLAAVRSEACQHVFAYDPIAPGGLDATDPEDAEVLAWDRAIIERLASAVRRGEPEVGVRGFVEAWNEVRWSRLPSAVRDSLVGAAPRLVRETEAVGRRDIDALSSSRSTCDVTLMTGQRSPPMVARMVAQIARRLPRAHRHSIEGCGHMGPVTHGPLVASWIEQALTP